MSDGTNSDFCAAMALMLLVFLLALGVIALGVYLIYFLFIKPARNEADETYSLCNSKEKDWSLVG